MAWRKASPRDWGMFGMGLGSGLVAGGAAVALGAKATSSWVWIFIEFAGAALMIMGTLMLLQAPKQNSAEVI